MIVGSFAAARARCAANALLVFAGFGLGQPAAPIPAAADERQRGKRQQRAAHDEQRERDRALQASEYGFWANVNPQVPHPRWSQATEELIGRNERRPTLIFNGYGDYVADLYRGLENERLWA